MNESAIATLQNRRSNHLAEVERLTAARAKAVSDLAAMEAGITDLGGTYEP